MTQAPERSVGLTQAPAAAPATTFQNDTPAEYLVLGVNPARRYAMSRWQANDPTDRNTSDLSVRKGGIQVEYEDEDPIVHQIFEEELRKRGIQCRMKGYVPSCTGVEGPSKKGEWGDEKAAPL